MKVPKALSLDWVINESKRNPEIIAIRNTLSIDKWESELVKPYFKVKNEFCEYNNVILRGDTFHYQSLFISRP